MPLTALSLCPAPRTTSIPAENPAASLIIGREDFQRIKEAAQVLTKEEREAKLAALKAEKEAILVGISPPAPSFPACLTDLGLRVEVDAPR